ncbi:MAG TPA: SAM-dependent methyltransferase [Micromonosporaceae bacterium]|jgi:hypothetical protein
MDWREWHDQYDQPGSALQRRLESVQRRIHVALDDAPPGALRVISVCAGQGRDLLGVLPEHRRRDEVHARLVELDEHNATVARRAAQDYGLTQVEVIAADAALTDVYLGMVPADLVLLCGVFGNIAAADIATTIATCPQLCATGATVVWTRHRRDPDMFVKACEWFEAGGFERVWLSDPSIPNGVGVHHFAGASRPLVPGQRMFRFIRGDDRPSDV